MTASIFGVAERDNIRLFDHGALAPTITIISEIGTGIGIDGAGD